MAVSRPVIVRPSPGDLIWAGWVGGTAAAFAVLEAIALRDQRWPTLSATLSRWLGTHPHSPRGDLGAFLLGAAWLGLTIHIARYRGE